MKRYITILLAIGAPSIVLGILLSPGGYAERLYSDFYSTLAANSKAQWPAEFVGPMQIVLAIFILVVFSYIGYLIAVSNDRPAFGNKFSITFYARVTLFAQTYFNDRVHEIKRNTLSSYLASPDAMSGAIIDVLYCLREALISGYKQSNVRITFMIPQNRSEDKSEDKVRLYIGYWANRTKKAPITFRRGIGFAKSEGFAGYAWATGRTQIGNKKILGFLKEKRYKSTSNDQMHVKSFCCIPIFDEGPMVDGRPLLGVLCIDSDVRNYFPRSRRAQLEFVRALQLFVLIINFHMAQFEKSQMMEGEEENPVDNEKSP